MPSPFDALDALTQAAVDKAFGDVVQVQPQTGDLNYGGGADPGRPVRNLRMTVGRAGDVRNSDYPASNRDGAPAVTTQSEGWVERPAYLALGYELRRGDVILSAGRRLVVAAVHAGDFGDVQIVFSG